MKQIFESERLSFVEVSEALVPGYLAMVNDYEHVNKYIGGAYGGSAHTYTEEDEIRWVRAKLEDKTPVFSMIEKKSGEYVGNIELMDLTETEAELGIALTAAKQDQGFGTEAVTALIRYGFEQFGLRKITLRTRLFNGRAFHVYQKCGFRETGRDDSHIFMEVLSPAGSQQSGLAHAGPAGH